MAKTTKNVTEEIVEKSEVAVEAVEIAPEVETVEAAPAEEVTEKADKKPSTDAENAEEDSEDSTEKAAKPMTDEEESAAMAAAETPADEDAEAKKKPMAPKSDEVLAEADNTVDLNQAFSDLVSTVKSLQAEVEMLKSSKVDVDVAKQSFEAVAKDIASATNTFNEFGKRVELVEQDTAFRKSGDLGEIVQNQPETVEKSLWGGSFLKTADLFN